MKLSTTRILEEMKKVLQDPNSPGPDPVYWVFSEVGGKWENITIIASGKYHQEYPKTFGHYHGVEINETYHLIEGEGVVVLQKKHFENGEWVPEKVAEVVLIKAKPGDKIVITPQWGHSWSNTGPTSLITYDSWHEGHSPRDYENIEKLHGMAYYLVEEDGHPKAVPNPNYRELPEPLWFTPGQFNSRASK